MFKLSNTVAAALFSASMLTATAASAAVIDFEDVGFVHGTVINTQISGVTVSAKNNRNGNKPDLAVVFDSDLSATRDSDLEAPFYPTALDKTNKTNGFNPGNILIIQENNKGCGDGVCNKPDDQAGSNVGYFKFVFDEIVTLDTIDFFDVESSETAPNAIQLFDENDQELAIGSFFVPNTGGDNLWKQVAFNLAGVKTVQINMGGSGAIDNIVYTTPSEVPVPAAALLFGPALLGFMGLRRKVKSSAA